MAKAEASFFTVIVTGQIEFADVSAPDTRPRRPHPRAPISKTKAARRVGGKNVTPAHLADPSQPHHPRRQTQIPSCDNAYCKYAIVHGDDWTHLDGPEDGISQITRKTSSGPEQKLVWNFPVEVTYKATNAFGWPQLILSVYEIDAMGRDIIKGYGCVHLPIASGNFVRTVPLYKPLPASIAQQFINWATGRPAEFSNPKFPAMGEGREVTRVQSTGHASVALNVITKDMATFGYSEAKGAAVRVAI